MPAKVLEPKSVMFQLVGYEHIVRLYDCNAAKATLALSQLGPCEHKVRAFSRLGGSGLVDRMPVNLKSVPEYFGVTIIARRAGDIRHHFCQPSSGGNYYTRDTGLCLACPIHTVIGQTCHLPLHH